MAGMVDIATTEPWITTSRGGNWLNFPKPEKSTERIAKYFLFRALGTH